MEEEATLIHDRINASIRDHEQVDVECCSRNIIDEAKPRKREEEPEIVGVNDGCFEPENNAPVPHERPTDGGASDDYRNHHSGENVEGDIKNLRGRGNERFESRLKVETEQEQHNIASEASESITTSLQSNEFIPLGDGNVEPTSRDLHAVPCIFRQDVVRSNKTGAVGIVTEVAGESDSDGSTSDDEDDEDDDEEEEEEDEDVGQEQGVGVVDTNANESNGKDNGYNKYKSADLQDDHVRVIWLGPTEPVHCIRDLTVLDREFLHGDYVASASDPTGQIGVVVDVNISVDLLAQDDSHTIAGVSTKDIKRVREFAMGDYVVLQSWLGRVDDVFDNVTVLFDDGSLCKVIRAEPTSLKPVLPFEDNGNVPYYPGQRVRASSSSVFKNARWLSGLWKANRLEGTVTKVTPGSVFIYWIASSGYGSDSSTPPAEEQSPKNLKLLSCFVHANWQVFDWCLLPFSSQSSSAALDKETPNSRSRDSTKSKRKYGRLGGGSSSKEVKVAGSGETVESMHVDLDHIQIKGNNKTTTSPESSSCSSSLSVAKELVREPWPLRKKIRKVVIQKDKKLRKKDENFEKALLIVNSKTKVDVAWQDGTIDCGLESTTLIPIDNPGDQEFVPEQYVVEKPSDEVDDASEPRRVGVVRSVNAKERTTIVRWLKRVARAEDPREFELEETVSVYEIEGHPDYDYCYGDVVVRLCPVSTPVEPASVGGPVEDLLQQSEPVLEKQYPKQQFGGKKAEDASGNEDYVAFDDLSWVGNITGLQNGDIEVTWADGMVSTVGPQAIYVVGRDDDDSVVGGSVVGDDDAASWETVDDDDDDDANIDEMDTHETTHKVLDRGSISETEESFETKIATRNAALALPLAALGFVTRLASGLFSGRRKNIDEEHEAKCEQIPDNSGGKGSPGQSSSNMSAVVDDYIGESLDEMEQENVTTSPLDVSVLAKDSSEVQAEKPEHERHSSESRCTFKRFDIVKDPFDHYFLGASGQNSSGRKWLKKIQQDWNILQNNLPDGIYVRVYEDRMDLLRAVIVGAYGTPYQDGLFFFDFHLPPEYPDVPPSAYYHSGGWRINPNLYEEGKVCLSLLNTWTGRGNEVWDPTSSSILQVLVSLQGLVLNSKPYFNEAGYDKQIGTAEGEKNSLSYNENTFLLSCKMMMYLMRKPPKDFEDLIRQHFKRRGYFILKACDAFMKGYLIGSLTEDASVDDSDNTNSTSVGFKLMLGKIVPKLLVALNDVGADVHEFQHLQQSS